MARGRKPVFEPLRNVLKDKPSPLGALLHSAIINTEAEPISLHGSGTGRNWLHFIYDIGLRLEWPRRNAKSARNDIMACIVWKIGNIGYILLPQHFNWQHKWQQTSNMLPLLVDDEWQTRIGKAQETICGCIVRKGCNMQQLLIVNGLGCNITCNM